MRKSGLKIIWGTLNMKTGPEFSQVQLGPADGTGRTFHTDNVRQSPSVTKGDLPSSHGPLDVGEKIQVKQAPWVMQGIRDTARVDLK